MTRFISAFLILILAWTSTVQAFMHDDVADTNINAKAFPTIAAHTVATDAASRVIEKGAYGHTSGRNYWQRLGVNMVARYGAGQLGAWHKAGHIPTALHVPFHGGLAAAAEYALTQDSTRAMAAGVGAMVAEGVAEMVLPTYGTAGGGTGNDTANGDIASSANAASTASASLNTAASAKDHAVSPAQLALTHGMAEIVSVLTVSALYGADNWDALSACQTAAQRALTYNHASSVNRGLDDDGEDDGYDIIDAELDELSAMIDYDPDHGHISLTMTDRDGMAPQIDTHAITHYNGDVRALTPRSFEAVLTYRRAERHNQDYLRYSQAIDPMTDIGCMADLNDQLVDAVALAQGAYVRAQADIAADVYTKHVNHEPLTAYESQVRTDNRREQQRFWKSLAGQVAGAGLAVGVALTAPATAAGTAAVAVGSAAGGMLSHYAAHDYTLSHPSDYLDLAISGFKAGALGYVSAPGVGMVSKVPTASMRGGVETTQVDLNALDLAGELNRIRMMPQNVAHHGAEANAWKRSHESRARGLKMWKNQPDPVTIEIGHNVGPRHAFDQKMNPLRDLSDRGKLVKTQSVRDDSVTFQYRKALLDRAKHQWKASNPEKFSRFKDLLDSMHADHVHELQLGGLDHRSMLSMLDKSVNTSFGSQIGHRIRKLPDGTPIRIIEKGNYTS